MSTETFQPDRFTQLHNSLHEVMQDLFGQHGKESERRLDRIELTLKRMEIIMSAQSDQLTNVISDLVTGFNVLDGEIAALAAKAANPGTTPDDLSSQISSLQTLSGNIQADINKYKASGVTTDQPTDGSTSTGDSPAGGASPASGTAQEAAGDSTGTDASGKKVASGDGTN